ncbi:glycosyltransferase family 39 protein [Corallococcus macrosporus]|uniref:Glycosyltransferase family 39 protein n=1 Tax=Corallococcus macrosporus TaxID=35 RepID=A0ABS3D6F9_9BACT|nr:glycosyltransferase family 39 protein [Corallococcus macrosporus]
MVRGGLGLLLVAAFFGLALTNPGLRVTFLPPWSHSSSGELYLWLGHALLLVPGGALLGLALLPVLPAPLGRLWRRVEALDARERRVALLLLGMVAFLAARLGRFVFLRDFPITDDEVSARFGGQVLASGHLLTPLVRPAAAMTGFYLHARDGLVTSFEWLGLQLTWALSEVTGTGSLIFSLVAAVPVMAVTWVTTRRLGPAWGAVAAALLLLSPMAAMLSMTTHAHLLSRAALAVAVAVYLRARDGGGARAWALLGLVSGVSFLCRPFETLFFLLPFYLELLGGMARRQLPVGACLGGLALGWVLPLVAFLAFNHVLTGNALLPARMAMYISPVKLTEHDGTLLERFGTNTSYNALMLAVWFLGPVGVALVALGASWDRLTVLLSLSVLSLLGLALFHDDHGIHAVGPIHYSECAPALVLVAVHGLKRAVDFVRRAQVSAWPLMLATGGSLAVGLGIFDVRHALALREQSAIHETVQAYVRDAGLGRAVLLVPSYMQVWQRVPAFRDVGSWVFEWTPPRPDFSDDVLLFHDGPGHYEQLRERFSDRRFFRLKPGRAPAPWRIIPADSPREEPGATPPSTQEPAP